MPLQIIRDDLTTMTCDAVVNPTDEHLSGGGGLDQQLHRAAGKRLSAACARIGSCAPGEAVLTRGYDLPARYVIHTAGPRWAGGAQGETETLAACYRNSLNLAARRRLRSVAFPLIAAGSFGFPKEQALEIAVREIRAFLSEQEMDVFLVVFNRECYEIGLRRRHAIQAFIDQNYVDQHTPMPTNVLYKQERRPLPTARPPMPSGSSAPAPPSAPKPSSKKQKASERPNLPSAPPPPPPQASIPWEESRADEDMVFGSFSLPGPDQVLDESFSEMLLRKIDERGMKDSECYKKANVDRKLFSKIRNSVTYQPRKTTAIAFAIALELDLRETRELLMKAGFALSRSQRFDVIIEYFIRERIYDIYEINEALFAYDQPLLGA